MKTPLRFFLALAVLAAGCGSDSETGPDDTGPSPITSPPYAAPAATGETPNAGNPPAHTPATGFPCEVRAVLQTYCAGCHTGQTYAPEWSTRDFLASPAGDGAMTWGARAAMLVQEGQMPPYYVLQRPAPEEQAVIVDWVAAGMPAGVCGPLTRPGLPGE